MLKLENTQVFGWEAAIRGMRNPKNSWDKMDSFICSKDKCSDCPMMGADWFGCTRSGDANFGDFVIGPNDHKLMTTLASAGPVHGKFRRMIMVTVDVTAPLYWWKEFDTYKVGTVANSCSTMHKIHAKPFTREDFSCELLLGDGCVTDHDYQNSCGVLDLVIDCLNFWRDIYVGENTEEVIGKGDRRAWDQMIQLLPSSYNQKRTLQLSYEVAANIHQYRRHHKLQEWHTFCDWIENLPYSELILCSEKSQSED